MKKGDTVRLQRAQLADGNMLKQASSDPYITGTCDGPSLVKAGSVVVAFPLDDGSGGEFLGTFKEVDVEVI